MTEEPRPLGRPDASPGHPAGPPQGPRPQGPSPQGPPPGVRPAGPPPQQAPAGPPRGAPPPGPGSPGLGSPGRVSPRPTPQGAPPGAPPSGGPRRSPPPPGATDSTTQIRPDAEARAEALSGPPAEEPTPAHGAQPSSAPQLSVVKVTGQAFAAITAAAVGAVLGGAGGTIVGAGLAAIVTTVGSALYQRSLERTRDVVRTRIHPRRPTHGRAPTAPDGDATALLEGPTVVLGAEDGDTPSPGGRPWRRYALLAATGLLVFLIALLAITGIERVKGSPLSGGERGTSVGTMFGGGDATATTTTTAPSTEDSAPTSAPPQDETDGATTTTEAPASTTTTSRAPTLVPTGLLPN